MSLSKAEQARKARAARNRRYYERKQEAARMAAAIERGIQEGKARAAEEQRRAEEAARLHAEALKRRCVVCGQTGASFDLDGIRYCSEHGAQKALAPVSRIDRRGPINEPDARKPPCSVENPPLPPIRRPDPLTVDPANDPWCPSWYRQVDPEMKPIQVGINPLSPWRTPPTQGTGQHTA